MPKNRESRAPLNNSAFNLFSGPSLWTREAAYSSSFCDKMLKLLKKEPSALHAACWLAKVVDQGSTT